jgi:hypothetical protein
MALSDFIDALPEDKREAFKQEISSVVSIKEIDRHPEFQRQLSLKHETTMANWQKDKLPSLIEEEIKKRGTKQPWELEIEKLRAENAEIQRSAKMKEREAQAMAELSRQNIDPDLARFIVTDDEEAFRANIGVLTGSINTLRDKSVKEAKESILGRKAPEAGQANLDSIKAMPLTERMKYAATSPEAMAQVMALAKTGA